MSTHEWETAKMRNCSSCLLSDSTASLFDLVACTTLSTSTLVLPSGSKRPYMSDHESQLEAQIMLRELRHFA